MCLGIVMPKGILKGDIEEDALTYSRRYYNWGKGMLKWIKRKYNKRQRKDAKAIFHKEIKEGTES